MSLDVIAVPATDWIISKRCLWFSLSELTSCWKLEFLLSKSARKVNNLSSFFCMVAVISLLVLSLFSKALTAVFPAFAILLLNFYFSSLIACWFMFTKSFILLSAASLACWLIITSSAIFLSVASLSLTRSNLVISLSCSLKNCCSDAKHSFFAFSYHRFFNSWVLIIIQFLYVFISILFTFSLA